MSLIQDLRFAMRIMRRTPGFVITAMLTLALGVGANTAVYSLLDQALLRALPVWAPEQLVVLSAPGKAWEGHTSDYGAGEDRSFSYPMYRDLRDRAQVFSGLIATAPATVAVTHDQTSEIGNIELVGGNYFTVLGLTPALGRLFTQADDQAPGANPVVVLSHRFWTAHLGADTAWVGKTITLNSHAFQVIGIAPADFQSAVWAQVPDVFVPMSMLDAVIPGKGQRLNDRTDRWLNIIGRLREDESREQAEAGVAPLWFALRAEELKALGHRSPFFVDEFLTRSRLRLEPGALGLSYNRSEMVTPLLAVMAMAALVLVLATVNVGGLLLVRAAGRLPEFALRRVLGARSGRILRQLLMEGLLIGALGSAGGMVLAPSAMRLILRQIAGPNDQSAFHATLDGRLLGFGILAGVGVSLLFSLAPALQLFRSDMVAGLKQKVATASGGILSLRRVIVSLQVGLSVLLLTGAGLFVRTVENLKHADAGFNTTHLLAFYFSPQLAGYKQSAIAPLEAQTVEAMRHLPGVQAVAASDDGVLVGNGQGGNVTVAGYTHPPNEEFDIEESVVNAGYFQAMQIPIVAGRGWTETDDATTQPVAVVNETFARHYFRSTAEAIGQRVSKGAGDNLHYMTIIGVSRDTRHRSLRDPISPTLFMPFEQVDAPSRLFVYLRTAMPPEQMFQTARSAMRSIDPALTVGGLITMDDQIEQSIKNERMIELLGLAFGGLATLLTGIGLYGVLAYTAVQRTREIGIRIALGSTRWAITRLVFEEVLRLGALGVLVGVPCAVLLARALKSQLFGVSTMDPVTIAVVVFVMGLVGLTATYLPARRASRIQPVDALRSE